jgi:apolipoprotein N-acyltransferase
VNRDERNAIVATIGLAIAALGAFSPWARIGGRNRSGFNTADTFISLADGALPDQVAWVGRWWYLPAFLAFIAWATTFTAGHRTVRAIGIGVISIGLAMWWLFYWAGENYDLLDMKLPGPIIATVGFTTIGYCCSRRRGSILNPQSTNKLSAPNE